MKPEDWASEMEQRERAACIERARIERARTKHKPCPQTKQGICCDCLDPVEAHRPNALRCLSCQRDEDHRLRCLYGGHHAGFD
jgi:hypothetical protein